MLQLMKIIDNKTTRLKDELLEKISPESEIRISVTRLTVAALFELKTFFSIAEKVKILLSYSENDLEEFQLLESEREYVLRKDLNRKYKTSTVSENIKTKSELRYGKNANLNLIIIKNPEQTLVYNLGVDPLDAITIGKLPSSEEMAILSYPDDQGAFLLMFETAWEHSKKDIKIQLLSALELGLKEHSGEAIYKYSMREIFNFSTINERADEKLKRVGFKDSVIWSMLYNFQKDAVIGAIDKIETYGGCIIADSVGLGKTFEALGVIKYYQLRNSRILVLAPKKLRDNWTLYKQNDKRNILEADRLNYDVLNHTDLSREKGLSGDIDLRSINWGNYDLVVIDESHNFRNNPGKKKMSRYKRLMDDVIKSNIRTKVLMLSATPVNNRMNDLKNQIAFITEGDDRAFLPFGIQSINQVMKDSQRRFSQWYKNTRPEEYSASDLMSRLDGNYFKILDMLTIARSRKHIEKYYDTTDIGKFPERLSPITLKPDIDSQNQFKDIVQLYDEISTLTLAAYSPLAYVRSEKREEYEEKYDMETATGSVFRMVDREQSLIYLMRVNLLKRLESSINSFRITLDKLIQFIDANLSQIEEHQNGRLDTDFGILDIDIDDVELEDYLVGGKIKVLVQDVDQIRWRQDLQKDQRILNNLLANIKLINADRDAKLQQLKHIVKSKVEAPINADNKKVIVFTAFADTAKYLYNEIAEWIKEEEALYAALVTGSGDNKTNMPGVKGDLISVLNNFSPKSKKRETLTPEATEEIDILICTDCISEGQNLQDCDYLVNYDIHWNPVRIIQRFGRIDRIGSTNERIQLVNFFPNVELDSLMDLIARVQGRMVMLDVSATGEENMMTKNSKEMQDLDYRKRQLKQLQKQVIDLEDVQGNISITDLTFNDFKIDIENSSDEDLEALKLIPPGSYAVVESNLDEIKEGVLFCLKDRKNIEGLGYNNIIRPYYLVYISKDGQYTIKPSGSKMALDYFRKLCMGSYAVQQAQVSAYNHETQGQRKVGTYVELLNQAIREITGVKEELTLDSLLNPEGTALAADSAGRGAELELVSYLIIK